MAANIDGGVSERSKKNKNDTRKKQGEKISLTLKDAPSTSTDLSSFLFFDDDDDDVVGVGMEGLPSVPAANESTVVDDDGTATVVVVSEIEETATAPAFVSCVVVVLLPAALTKALPEARRSMSICRCGDTSHCVQRSVSRVFTNLPFIVSCMWSRNDLVCVNKHCQARVKSRYID